MIQEIENLIHPVLAQNHFELVETQYRREGGGWVLRLFIDRAQETPRAGGGSGVTLGDCEHVSHIVGNVLDHSELIKDSYTLEVSSPGVNRPLKNRSHFGRYIGERVKVSCYAPLSPDSKQKNFAGVLLSCKEDIIEVQDQISGRVAIPFAAIAKAHLDIL